MIPVQDASRKAYHELKDEGKITPRQDVAFKNIREFYEEKGYWPTPKEVHTFLALEKADAIAQFEGPNYVKPRITEMIVGNGDEGDPDLLEKEDSRDQEYIEEVLNRRGHGDYEAKEANPVKIRNYQSTLSEEEGEAAELQNEDESTQEPSNRSTEDEEDEEFEIPYSVNGGSEVRMANPEEAIAQTDDLEGVEEMLEEKDLLEEYQEEIEAVREDRDDSGSDDVDEVVVDDEDLVEDEGEQYVFDRREDPDADVDEPPEEDELTNPDSAEESDDGEDSEQQKILMEDGEIVG